MEQAWTVKRRRDAERVQCPLCHDALADDAVLTECADCHAVHHTECWTDLDRCAACTCARGRAPAATVTPVDEPAPAPRGPGRCAIVGCRRLVELPHRAPRAGRGEADPTRCEPHSAQAAGLGIVSVAGGFAVVLACVVWIDSLVPSDKGFPSSWGLACFYYGLPIVFLAWGLLTLAWGVVAERTTPNEPTLPLRSKRDA